MEGSVMSKPSSQPIVYGNERIIGPDSDKKSSCLRSYYSSKKYNNLRSPDESVDRLSALNNVSTKKPEYIQKHIDLATNTISSALCSTNPNVVQKSIENELRDSYWLFYYVVVNNLCSTNQIILDESLQLIYDMHSCFQPEYFITTIKETLPNAKKPNHITSYLFCLYQLLLDCRENIKSYCPIYFELLLTMKQCYKPLRKLCHMIGQLLNDFFSSNELKELIETNLNNDQHNIRKFCKLYSLHRKDFSVDLSINLSNKKNNKNKSNIYNDDESNNSKNNNFKNDLLPSLLKPYLKINNNKSKKSSEEKVAEEEDDEDDDDINNYNDYYDSDKNSVFSDSEKTELIKDLLEESQEIVNQHEIKYRESDIDVLLVDRNSEVSEDDTELEYNSSGDRIINNNNNQNNIIRRTKRVDSSDDEGTFNKRSSTGSLNKNDIDYGLLCSDTDEMKVDTTFTKDGKRRPQSQKLLPVSFDNNNNNNNKLPHSKLNVVTNYRDMAISPVEEVSLEEEISNTPQAQTRTIRITNTQPQEQAPLPQSSQNEGENSAKPPLIHELVKESQELLEKTGGKVDSRKTSMYDELLNVDRESYVESDFSSGDVSRLEEETNKPKLEIQLSMDDSKKDEEFIHSILVDESPSHQSQKPDADLAPIN